MEEGGCESLEVVVGGATLLAFLGSQDRVFTGFVTRGSVTFQELQSSALLRSRGGNLPGISVNRRRGTTPALLNLSGCRD